MSLFFGHNANGTSFIVTGIRWTYCVLERHLLCRRQASLGRPDTHFRSTITHPYRIRPGAPIDAMLIFVLAFAAFSSELILGYLGGFPPLNVAMHSTVIAFYVITGVVFLLKHYRYLTIPDVEYVIYMMALLAGGFFMNVHAKGRSSMDALLHEYLGNFMTAVGVLLIVEMKFRTSVMATLCRCVATTALGSWMILVAYVLFPRFGEHWDEEDMGQMKIVSMMVLWIILANILLAGLLLCLAVIRVRTMNPSEVAQAMKISNSLSKFRNHDLDVEQSKCMLMQSDDEDC